MGILDSNNMHLILEPVTLWTEVETVLKRALMLAHLLFASVPMKLIYLANIICLAWHSERSSTIQQCEFCGISNMTRAFTFQLLHNCVKYFDVKFHNALPVKWVLYILHIFSLISWVWVKLLIRFMHLSMNIALFSHRSLSISPDEWRVLPICTALSTQGRSWPFNFIAGIPSL